MPGVTWYPTRRRTGWGGLALPPTTGFTSLQICMENKTQKLPCLCQGSPSSSFHAWLEFAKSKEPITGSEHPSVQAEPARLGQEAWTCLNPGPPARARMSSPAHPQESRSKPPTEKQMVSLAEPPAPALHCQRRTGAPCSARGWEINPHPGPALCTASAAPVSP